MAIRSDATEIDPYSQKVAKAVMNFHRNHSLGAWEEERGLNKIAEQSGVRAN